MTSGQRQHWKKERGSWQLNAEKTGHAGGELNATSHVTAHRLLKMGSFKLWEIVKTNLSRDWDFTINMKSLCHYLGDGGTEKDS